MRTPLIEITGNIRLFQPEKPKMAEEEDLFDSLLGLEEEFYKEGYELGVSDGKHAGLIEGRLFGLEKAFEKYVAVGRLHGKAMVWAGRLPDTVDRRKEASTEKANEKAAENLGSGPLTTESQNEDKATKQVSHGGVPILENPRLRTHVRTLYALTEPGSLSTENNEGSVADFEDRLKRAEGKIKVIEKITGEHSKESQEDRAGEFSKAKGEGGIEDISSLHARH